MKWGYAQVFMDVSEHILSEPMDCYGVSSSQLEVPGRGGADTMFCQDANQAHSNEMVKSNKIQFQIH